MTAIVETFFRSHANAGWICEGEELRFAEINDAALERYGLSVEAFKRLTLRDLQPGTAPLLTSVRMMQSDMLSRHDEVLLHHFADGSILELTLRGVSVTIAGRAYRLVISRDVTHRARRNRPNRQLAYVERQSARIARMGGWRYDTEAQTFAYSAAAHTILSLGHDDGGEPSAVIEAITPEHRAMMRHAFEACADFGEPIDRAFSVIDRRGNPRLLRTMAEPEFDLSGKVVGIIGVVQDMTGYRTREDELAAQQAIWAQSEGSGPLELI